MFVKDLKCICDCDIIIRTNVCEVVMGVVIQEGLTIEKKLEILADAAKYDVACTSSGVNRKGTGSGIGNSLSSGICHSFSSDGRCISLLKILFTNECVFDCKYCINRSSNDLLRASFTPEEVCDLTMEFYRRNYIEGLFLSSGVIKSPNYTMELICKTLKLLREVYHFNGYIHCKAVPSADPSLIEMTGWYADRMSVNLELPTASGLKQLAPHKSRNSILRPMKQIQLGRSIVMNDKGYYSNGVEASSNILLQESNPWIYNDDRKESIKNSNIILSDSSNNQVKESYKSSFGLVKAPSINRAFVPGGQSTQLIVGAIGENDYEIMSVSEALYNKFQLKRVFYSAYVPINSDNLLPQLSTQTPLLREHRLYQADFLLRFYGFKSKELLSVERPNFNLSMDPKCNWAVNHLEHFPVEVNKADYYTLLRVPGIGTISANKIIVARRNAILKFEDLKKMGVVLKRAVYFITCAGKMMYQINMNESFISSQLSQVKESLPLSLTADSGYKQMNLFDNYQLEKDESIMKY